MDDVKLTAQQRFDLLDMTRLRSYIHEAFADIISDIFGAAHHNAGAAGFLQKKPLIVRNFNITEFGGPSLVLRAERTWTGGADGTHSAHIYDQAGARITGPNSPVYRDLTVAAAPGATTRYLMVRRVVGGTDDTLEARNFYTTAGGHATTNVNTRTIDDYELQDSVTSADTDATLSAAGWVDIATFETDGAADINVGPTALATDVERALLTWAVAPPVADQTILTLFEDIQALVQLVKRMRIGEGTRVWTDNITNDAAFDEEGGIRYGKGDTLDTGLTDVYTRVQGASEIVTDCNKTAAVLGDLEDHMSSICYTRPASAGYGYRYATAIGSVTEAEEDRIWTYGAASFLPVPDDGFTPVDPWTVAANPVANDNHWYVVPIAGLPKTPIWAVHYDPSVNVGDTDGLGCSITLPPLCQIDEVAWYVDFVNHLGNNDFLFCRATVSGGLSSTKNYTHADGGIFSAGGTGLVVAYDTGTHVYSPTSSTTYHAELVFYASGGVPNTAVGTLVRVYHLYVKVNIREASYVY